MTPLDVISLADAKAFLRVDFSDDNDLIESLISSSVGMVEQITQYRLYQRDEVIYVTDKYYYEAFQFPLNSSSVAAIDSADTNTYTTRLKYETLRIIIGWPVGFWYWDNWYTFFTNYYYQVHPYNGISFMLTLNVGYTDAAQIPTDLITAVKQIISYNYENRDMTKADLPNNIMMLLNNYRRFATLL